MAALSSTGLRNGLLITGSFRTLLSGTGEIRIYAGPVPASADAATTGATLLVTIRKNGTDPITFSATATDGVLPKTVGEAWSGVNAATGSPSFYRLVLTADDNAASTTAVRLQDTVATAGAGINLTAASLTSGATQTLDYYTVALPV